jgi:talin
MGFIFRQLQQDLQTAAANLNDASTGVAVSVGSPGELADSSKRFGSAFTDILTICMEMAGQNNVIISIFNKHQL